MIRIGGVNIDVSHPLAFSEHLQKENRARYVAVYNDGFRGDDEVEGFIKSFSLEKRCNSIEELADMVDIGFIQSCNWDNHLKQAMPFIERGKPVFIDKPIAGTLADCHKLEELAADGAVIIGSSSLRYCDEVVAFNNQTEDERGKIMNIYGTAGVDEFNYAIHIVEAIGALAGTGAESCKYVGGTNIDGKKTETFSIRFKNGIIANYTTFQGAWQPCEVVIMTTSLTHQFRVDTSKIYRALLDQICDFMETGNSDLASITTLTESIKIMLAGRISHENNGTEIKLIDIPAEDPGYNGDKFEKEYAATASKMYI
jgi:hypothetical protein